MKVDNGTINFAIYEDSTEFYGMAEVTLPEISHITEEIKGAGIAGAFNSGYIGHLEAMTLTLNFRSVTKDAIKLQEPRNHQLDLRAAQQYRDNTTGTYEKQNVKHIIIASPTKFTPGKVAPASPAEASGEFSVTYFATFLDGKKMLEVDILNFIYFVNGTDYLADVRKALGK
ncbi:MAG: phage tail protein [Lachnospiraceae bacterium]|nr:phage tail protein [Lachnospiraceae bacterium]